MEIVVGQLGLLDQLLSHRLVLPHRHHGLFARLLFGQRELAGKRDRLRNPDLVAHRTRPGFHVLEEMPIRQLRVGQAPGNLRAFLLCFPFCLRRLPCTVVLQDLALERFKLRRLVGAARATGRRSRHSRHRHGKNENDTSYANTAIHRQVSLIIGINDRADNQKKSRGSPGRDQEDESARWSDRSEASATLGRWDHIR